MDFQRLERLLVKHKDAVYRQMVRVCGNKDEAEDALASAILAALRTQSEIADEEAFSSWLSTIGRRICARMHRRPAFAPIIEEISVSDDPVIEMEVMKSCVREALDGLPVTMKQIYIDCEIDEIPIEEAAMKGGISLAAAKSRLHRARKIVRARLDRSICGS